MKPGKILIILLGVAGFYSCSEKEILREVPRDFLTTANAFKTPSDIENALNELYYDVREYKGASIGDERVMDWWLGTDVGWASRNYKGDALSDHTVLTPTNRYPIGRWTPAYKIIANANVVISRIRQITYADSAEKNENLAQALFFRAWTYRILAYLFGDVPLVLEESQGPKRDYTRTPKIDVYKQCKADLDFAVANLNSIDQVVDGRLSKEAANHLLSEIDLALSDYQGAVDAATKVIENPHLALMTNRFGTYKDEPGNVYSDLFKLNNQNRSSGNTEGIWVLQVEYNKPGGWGDGGGNNQWERNWGPLYWLCQGPDGQYISIGENDYSGGRAGGFFRMTPYFLQTVWQSDYNNDIRNSEYIIKRKWRIDNPGSANFNDTIDFNKPYTAWKSYLRGPDFLEEDTNVYIYPFPLKYNMINHHEPAELIDGGPLLVASARATYIDNYEMRLAETYLLRAEGYLGLGDKVKAAADINVLRSRAQASPVDPQKVDIDYILDERLRELYCEEPRRLTLGRLGLIYDRARRYNGYASPSIQPFNNLWPIPFSEIEKNVGAKLAQNPGY